MSHIPLILIEVEREVNRAVSLHSPMKSRHEAYAVMFEEFDEFWDEVKKNPKKFTTAQEKSEWLQSMRDELIQIAAMAVRAINDLSL